MKKYILSLIIVVVLICGFKVEQIQLFSIPKGWPKPNYNMHQNPLRAATIELGRVLFYDPILSANQTISCASCHSVYTAFTHADHSLSHGINDRAGKRNSPALMNLAWHTSFMWDGAVNHLDMQALAPITNPDEMGESLERVISKLQASTLYPPLFYKAYGDSLITGQQTLKAISQFLLTLVSANSKYDSVMRKEAIFTQQEKKGYKLFRKNCSSCHTEPLFTNLQFENNGLPIDLSLYDFGRMGITLNPSDSLRFKVPTLRNIEFSFPYMHDGRFQKLGQVLNHYTNGIQQSSSLSASLKHPIILSSNDKVDLTAFLLTLTDKHFLFNPQFTYPKQLLSTNRNP